MELLRPRSKARSSIVKVVHFKGRLSAETKLGFRIVKGTGSTGVTGRRKEDTTVVSSQMEDKV